MDEFLYPLTLSYTRAASQVTVTTICANEDEADEAFKKMFDTCGQNVAYSVN